MSPDQKDSPCSCIDLSPEDTATDSASSAGGVFLGANLAFSQNNIHDNNNSPASATEKKAYTIGSLLKWRTGGIDGSSPAETGEPNDIKDPRKSSVAMKEEGLGALVEGGSEFLATAILMLMGCAGAYIEGDRPAANVYGSAAFGVAVYMATTIFGGLSGAHMNPLVTLLNVVLAGMSWSRAGVYIVSQAAGAVVGYGLLLVMIPPPVREAVEGASPQGVVCCTVPVDGMPWWSAVLAEFVVTALLLGAVSSTMTSTAPHVAPPAFQFGVLVFGICMVEAMYTGASMNPTRSLAAAAWTGVWDRFWVYIVGQTLATTFVIAVHLGFQQNQV